MKSAGNGNIPGVFCAGTVSGRVKTHSHTLKAFCHCQERSDVAIRIPFVPFFSVL